MAVFLLASCVVGCICSQIRLISAKTIEQFALKEPVLVTGKVSRGPFSRHFSIKFLCLVLLRALIGFQNHLEATLNSSVYFNKTNAAVKTNSVSFNQVFEPIPCENKAD